MEYLNYSVDNQLKELWNIELQISDVLLDVCNRFSLKLWAGYGTLLGAARHKGFIPWDDDMDFVMMREDYDKLLNLISSNSILLPESYEFDINNIRAIKLKRKDTTMKPQIWKYSSKLSYGVWVDIICLDIAPDDLTSVIKEYESLSKKTSVYLNGKLSYYAYKKNFRYKIGHFLNRWWLKIRNSNCYREQIENYLREDANRYSGRKVWGYMIWCTLVELKKIKMYDKTWFDETIVLPFEDRVLPCPIGWEEILTAQYGDWRTPVIGASQHEGTLVDINKPYVESIKEMLKQKPWWKRYWYKY